MTGSKLIFDVGMHKGEDTLFYLKKGFRVVGFEADPSLAASCRQRFATEIANGRLRIIEGAIVDCADQDSVAFFRNPVKSVWGTANKEWAERNDSLSSGSERIDVPTVDFAQCLQEIGIPYYLKIDIEGMDQVCLEALHGFEVKPQYVSVESEKVDFTKLLDELSLLKDLGYAQFMAVQQKGVSRVGEPDPVREGHRTGHRFEEGSSGLFGADLPEDQWCDYPDIVNRYVDIFAAYRLIGDAGILTRNAISNRGVRLLQRLLNRPIPGWYDTHARLNSP